MTTKPDYALPYCFLAFLVLPWKTVSDIWVKLQCKAANHHKI